MVCILISGIVFIYKSRNNEGSNLKFYRFGPHDDFMILGLAINTPLKYSILVIYEILNTFVRTIQHEVISPWIINNIQDIERKQSKYIKSIAYEITSINIIYQWVDWLIYMNMLLAQIDMVLIEILSNLIATGVTTFLYLKNNIHNKNDIVFSPLINTVELISSHQT
jgi:hypothetical protein